MGWYLDPLAVRVAGLNLSQVHSQSRGTRQSARRPKPRAACQAALCFACYWVGDGLWKTKGPSNRLGRCKHFVPIAFAS